MSKIISSIYPWVGAGLAGVIWWACQPRFPIDEKEFLAAALSLGAVLTGFITTAKAILAALPSDSVMGRLRQSGYINDLVDYLAHALYGCLIFSVLCIVGFFFLENGKPFLPNWYAIAWITLATFSLLAFFRVSRLLFQIIKFDPGAKVD